ncbi:MAG TPA: hypothetical protein VEV20_02945 [Burkholderiales bacterium]|nr:hypothetical protein [Burkholderiales bacterium]
MLRFAAILALTLGMAAAAYADDDGPTPSAVPPDYWHVHRAPEIDPSGAIAGLTLLAGGLAVLRGRRGKK